MTTAVKVTAGLGIIGTCLWLLGPAIFNAMVDNDMNNLRDGIRSAQHQAGSHVEKKRRGSYYESYMEKYAKGKI